MQHGALWNLQRPVVHSTERIRHQRDLGGTVGSKAKQSQQALRRAHGDANDTAARKEKLRPAGAHIKVALFVWAYLTDKAWLKVLLADLM